MPTPTRVRREPPPFRRVEVVFAERRTPHLLRITLGGPELEGLDPGLPAASVRLLLPRGDELVVPKWTGNEFLHADGTRPALRTVTPRRLHPERLELDVEVVLHGEGPLSTWATAPSPGGAAAVSGTGRGYKIDPATAAYALALDFMSLPMINEATATLPILRHICSSR